MFSKLGSATLSVEATVTQTSTLQSQMTNGSSSSLTERGPWYDPWTLNGKSALGSIQIMRSISADLLSYAQSDLSRDSHFKQLMKTISYVKLHFIQFSPGSKLTLKMFCLSEHFPLGAKGLMMYNPSWRFYGRASQSKHFFPLFYITLTNRNAEPFNYRLCLTHPESQIFWQRLVEREKCTEFPELLVKTMTPRKLVNNLAGPTVDATVCRSGPHGSLSASLAFEHCIPRWWYFVWASGGAARRWWAQVKRTKIKPQTHMSWAGYRNLQD